jgi:hypothetical protein
MHGLSIVSLAPAFKNVDAGLGEGVYCVNVAEERLSVSGMKVKTLQIIWHGKEPVFSLDFHRTGMLATAGGDKDIRVSHLAILQVCPILPGPQHLNIFVLCTAVGGGPGRRRRARSDAPHVSGWRPPDDRQLHPLLPHWYAAAARPCQEHFDTSYQDCHEIHQLSIQATSTFALRAGDVAGEQLASGADKGEVLLWRVDRDAVRGEETTWQRCLCRRATCSPSMST